MWARPGQDSPRPRLRGDGRDVVTLIRTLITAALVAGFDETTLRIGAAGTKRHALSGSPGSPCTTGTACTTGAGLVTKATPGMPSRLAPHRGATTRMVKEESMGVISLDTRLDAVSVRAGATALLLEIRFLAATARTC